MTNPLQPPLSKENLKTLIDTINKFGALLIEIGHLEKAVGSIDHFQEIFEKNVFGTISDIEKRPKISEKLGHILVRFLSLSVYMKKDFNSLSPDDKIKAGKIIKEIGMLMGEMADEYEK